DGADVEAGDDDQGADGVGQHVPEDHAEGTATERDRAGDVVLLLDPQHLAAHQPGIARPGHDGDRQHEVVDRLPEDDDDDQRDHQVGQRDHDVGEAHDDVVEDAADVAGDAPQYQPHDQADADHDDADAEGRARAPDEAVEDVVAAAGRAEQRLAVGGGARLDAE